eukprot:GAHX01000245.1.p1 GENE.GAHX01000245.1~~GAHX01000245.1.p1  ORF type:complete len:123 (-),score=35.44 GAHX01000245.1:43-411(-)
MFKPFKNFHKRQVTPKATVGLDCSKLVADELLDIKELEEFILLKLNSTRKNKILKNKYTAEATKEKIEFKSNIPMAKRCIKEFVKKYLHQNGLKEYCRIVSMSKGKYQLRYYNIQDKEEEEE